MTHAIPFLRRGQIVLAGLDPVVGAEAARTRPVVIVSGNTANAAALRAGGVVTIAEQVRPIPVGRVSGTAGWVPAERRGALDEALRPHLAL